MIRTEEVDQRLVTLRLIHFTELGHMPLDRSLIQGLAMFWRPETHTFHFPRVGEMTVDLEDFAFILGLPMTGIAVTGRTDYDDVLLLADLALPRDTPMEEVLDCFREKTKEGRPKKKNHAVTFVKLREMWTDGLGTQDIDRIDRYTRALVLELLGCELFPDATGDSNVSSGHSVKYNWGAATLVMLYRGLDNAAMEKGGKKIAAPWVLLQLWLYARLLVCRPSVTIKFKDWGLPSADRCPPYGKQWMTRRKSNKIKGPYRSGIEYARDVLLKMDHGHMVWRPYDEVSQVIMPPYARLPMRMYCLRVPCIHYWVVAWHHADRVMHQFMLYQTVPPPIPTVEVAEVRPWSDDVLPSYDRWMRVHGGAHLVPILGAAEQIPPAELTYLQEAAVRNSLVKHILTEALRGCTWAVKKGSRRAAKFLLKSCSTQLGLVGEPHRLPRLLEAKGLPTDIDSIPDT
ncbi:hypothetical protein LUZ63_012632 [Rhynchospora breviuscula]|uniref:Aminotransferase-like plant mobile domain-containing protein n=1 Tax=Rhynchospora breviuscula TaxID=2022672 RepID=A0A9Q0CL07_9POAL|nr:hypothetical protein LUZ63_012632 [Rhynchospora breviuscula]